MINNRRLARRYAKAFLHDTMGNDTIEIMADEVKTVVNIIESDKSTKEFFMSPINPQEHKLTVVRNFVKRLGLSKYTRYLFEMLIRRDRMALMTAIADELQEFSDRLNGCVRIRVTTSYEPSVSELEELFKRINKYYGRRTFVEQILDPSILGGFILEGDGKLIDMSVMGQIKRILLKV